MAAPVRLSGGQGITGRFYALDWNLKCDGQTPDHGPWNELIALIASLGTGGAQIDLPPFSTVILGGQVNLMANLTINIPASTTVQCDGVFTGTLFNGSGLSNVQFIGGGTIDGANSAANLINLASCPNIRIEGLTLQNTTHAVIYLDQCDYAVIEGNTVTNAGNSADGVIYSHGGCNHIRVEKNNITPAAGGSLGIGIETVSAFCEGAMVLNNVIDWSQSNVTLSGTTGILVYGNQELSCPHGVIRGNRVYAPFEGTIYGISANIKDGQITDNFVGTLPFSTTLAAAITTTNGTSATVAAGNPKAPAGITTHYQIDLEVIGVTAGATGTAWTITRGAFGSTAATHLNGAAVTLVNYGVFIGIEAIAKGMQVSHNAIDGIASSGIAIDGSLSPDQVIVSHNRVLNGIPNGGSTAGFGMQVETGSGHIIDANEFVDCNANYIYLNSSTNNHKITNNRFTIKNDPTPSAEKNAIRIQGGNNHQVSGNIVGPDPAGTSSTALQGIDINGGSNHTISFNSLNNQSPDGSQSPDGCIIGAYSSSYIFGNTLNNAAYGVHTSGGTGNTYGGQIFNTITTSYAVQAGDTQLVIGGSTNLTLTTPTLNDATFSGSGSKDSSGNAALNSVPVVPSGAGQTTVSGAAYNATGNITIAGLPANAVRASLSISLTRASGTGAVGDKVNLFTASGSAYPAAQIFLNVTGSGIGNAIGIDMAVTTGATNQIYYSVSGTSGATYTLVIQLNGYSVPL